MGHPEWGIRRRRLRWLVLLFAIKNKRTQARRRAGPHSLRTRWTSRKQNLESKLNSQENKKKSLSVVIYQHVFVFVCDRSCASMRTDAPARARSEGYVID